MSFKVEKGINTINCNKETLTFILFATVSLDNTDNDKNENKDSNSNHHDYKPPCWQKTAMFCTCNRKETIPSFVVS